MKHRSCVPVSFTTEDKKILNGLWFYSPNASKAVVFVHGLTSNTFAGHSYILPAVDEDTSILFFNNRGHDKVVKVKVVDPDSPKGTRSELIGATHEVFTDSKYDIQAAIDFVKGQGIDEITLAGHSTGCQKSVYYLAQGNNQKNVSGLILLCPLSDYATAKNQDKDGMLAKATKVAEEFVSSGRGSEILPFDVWPYCDDAQRFLSLFTPKSEEEIFMYSQQDKEPSTLKKVNVPMLVVFAENDEYADRDTQEIQDWFESHVPKDTQFRIIQGSLHSFYKKEDEVASVMKDWLKG